MWFLLMLRVRKRKVVAPEQCDEQKAVEICGEDSQAASGICFAAGRYTEATERAI
jgi:hypothetical protein